MSATAIKPKGTLALLMRPQDDLAAIARELEALMRAANNEPGTGYVLHLTIEGHRNAQGAYDQEAMNAVLSLADMTEQYFHHVATPLGSWEPQNKEKIGNLMENAALLKKGTRVIIVVRESCQKATQAIQVVRLDEAALKRLETSFANDTPPRGIADETLPQNPPRQ